MSGAHDGIGDRVGAGGEMLGLTLPDEDDAAVGILE